MSIYFTFKKASVILLFLFFVLILNNLNSIKAQEDEIIIDLDDEVEEFHMSSPTEAQSITMKKFIDEIRNDPTVNLSTNNAFLQSAHDYGVKRLIARPTSETLLQLSDSNDGITPKRVLALPSSADSDLVGTDSVLGKAVTNTTSSTTSKEMMTTAESNAIIVQLNEDIGTGALAMAGALKLGNEGQWLQPAIDKVQDKSSLKTPELFLLMAQKEIEKQTIAKKGLNESYEYEIYNNLTEWATSQGAVLRYMTPVFNREKGGIRLIANEPIGSNEHVISIPLKLIISRITARNIPIYKSGRYLGTELKSTFAKSEEWGLAVLLLHEWFKEHRHTDQQRGSRWGPFIRTLRARYLTTKVQRTLLNSRVLSEYREWMNEAKRLGIWTADGHGPCTVSSQVCIQNPEDPFKSNKFEGNVVMWGLWVVKQYAVTIHQKATGTDFLALVPFLNMMDKRVATAGDTAGGLTFELDGSLSIRPGVDVEEGTVLSTMIGELTDQDYFLRYLSLPVRAANKADEAFRRLAMHKQRRASIESQGVTEYIGDEDKNKRMIANPKLLENPHNYILLKIAGIPPKKLIENPCLKYLWDYSSPPTRGCEHEREARSEALRWKGDELENWRKEMKLPPRLSTIKTQVLRLHIYGDDVAEQSSLNNANKLLSGMWVDTDMDLDAQLELMGLSDIDKDDDDEDDGISDLERIQQQLSIVSTDGSSNSNSFIKPQLYSAPDPEEDEQTKRFMENLSLSAAQLQMSVSSPYFNTAYNASTSVLNASRLLFQYGILPKPGLDALDRYLSKKLDLLVQCGTDEDMRLTHSNISHSLLCAMRVHLMNESEVDIFCPLTKKAGDTSCKNVKLDNITAIGYENEMLVIDALRSSVTDLLSQYNETIKDDIDTLKNKGYLEKEMRTSSNSGNSNRRFGPMLTAAITIRMREKMLLESILTKLDEMKTNIDQGEVKFQLEIKQKERLIQNAIENERKEWMKLVEKEANKSEPLVVIDVNVSDRPDNADNKRNLTLWPGDDLNVVVEEFCIKNKIHAQESVLALKNALKERVKAKHWPVLELIMGVIGADGKRHVLGITTNGNYSLETSIFCKKYGLEGVNYIADTLGDDDSNNNNNVNIDASGGGEARSGYTDECSRLHRRVKAIFDPKYRSFVRNALAIVPVDSPDGRLLNFVVHQGEQHNLLQLVEDFMSYYHIDLGAAPGFANVVNSRLPKVDLTLPVDLASRIRIPFRLSKGDNVTDVINAFVTYYDVNDIRTNLLRAAEYGMKPGSFLV